MQFIIICGLCLLLPCWTHFLVLRGCRFLRDFQTCFSNHVICKCGNSFISFYLIYDPFISFLLDCVSYGSTMLHRAMRVSIFVLFLIPGGSNSVSLSIILLIGFLYMLFIRWESSHCSHFLLSEYCMELCQIFYVLINMIMWVSLFYKYEKLHWFWIFYQLCMLQ